MPLNMLILHGPRSMWFETELTEQGNRIFKAKNKFSILTLYLVRFGKQVGNFRYAVRVAILTQTLLTLFSFLWLVGLFLVLVAWFQCRDTLFTIFLSLIFQVLYHRVCFKTHSSPWQSYIWNLLSYWAHVARELV